MSSLSTQKTSVQIVCPHCRRSYRIMVDLKRIYRMRPRAICSRCGGKFEVIQRMSELGEESAAASDLSERASVSPGEERQRSSHRASADEAPKREAPERDQTTLEPRSPSNEEQLPSEQLADRHLEPQMLLSDDGPREVMLDESTRDPLSPPPPKPQSISDTVITEQPEDASGVERRSSPSWPDMSHLAGPGELRAPTPTDLEHPLPWSEGSELGLEILLPELPESVKALELLLVDHSRRSRTRSPGRLDPSPREESGTTVVPTGKTR